MENMEILKYILYSGNSSIYPYQRRLAIEEFEKLMDDYKNLKSSNDFLNDQLISETLKSEGDKLESSLSIADLQALKEMLDDRYQRTNLNEYKFKLEKVEDRIIEITDKFFKI